MRFRLVVPVLLAALFAAGCANDAYDPNVLREDLRKDGLSAEQADCVMREMRGKDGYGDARLGQRDEPSDAERATFDEILDECLRGADPSS